MESGEKDASKTKCILLVEGSLAYRLDLASSLRAELPGYLIDKVSNHPAMFRYFSHARAVPRLIVWCVELLLQSDFQALAQVRRHPSLKHIPIVALADDCNDEWILRCHQMGVLAYAVRPRSVPEVEALVKTIRLFGLTETVAV